MAKSNGRYNRHIILKGTAETKWFRSPQVGGGAVDIPKQNRYQHGSRLLSQIEELRPQADATYDAQKAAGMEEEFGIQIEFESFPEINLALKSLNRERSGIELQNVRYDKNRTMATVFVPDGKLAVFEELIRRYLDESKDSKSGPKNETLLNAISNIRIAALEALWTDDIDIFPKSDEESFWWEVWLTIRKNRNVTTEIFKQIAKKQGFRISSGDINFPERTVLLAYGSVRMMKESLPLLNGIAELRRAKETANFFDVLSASEQSDWLDDLLNRIKAPEKGADVPHICILDTGVNYGHQLIAAVLSDADVHTVDTNWGIHDGEGHGTEMAGLAMMGDLTEVLTSRSPIDIDHRLESVKLLHKNYSNSQDARHHGYLTIKSVAYPESMARLRRRVFSMAITAEDNRDCGRPSAWSAAIDRLTSDADRQAETPRLFIVSAGNAKMDSWADSPESNKKDGVHDPAQSWNALTVGATTNLFRIEGDDTENYQSVARVGGLSPFSTTSLMWDKIWPLKPDVVFEGGNAAKDKFGAVRMPSLSLLTTNSNPNERLLTTTNATSAASILAARMAAQIMAEYSDFWPETIRALIVHSAEWTDVMWQDFLSDPKNPKKGDFVNLVRCCGFGIPDLQRAMWSVRNSLTMICEEKLQPFRREGSNDPTLGEMHFHRLPWPLKELESLGETSVQMRITLSYFIEPNPSERGAPRSPYLYESHGLRYDVKRPAESEVEFRKRVNLLERDKDEKIKNRESDSGWRIGKNSRHRGSIHSDTWQGSAADLASRGMIGVYPTQGWWKTRPKHQCYDRMARYSLVVSILAPEVDVDIYSAVSNQIETPVVVES